MAVNTQSNLDLTTTSDQVTISYDYIGKFNDRSTLNGPGVIETPTITASSTRDGNVTDILGLGTGDWSTHKNIEEWTGHRVRRLLRTDTTAAAFPTIYHNLLQ